MSRNLLTAGVVAGLAFVLAQKATASMGRLSRAEVKRLCRDASAHFRGVDPMMLRAMVEVESSRDPHAIRYEWHINDMSVGLMQTLISTAQWLARDMGYRRYGVPKLADLLNPEVSVYFGAAYVHWLVGYGDGQNSEEWIVRAYNGGPGGATRAATEPYWEKYKAARDRLIHYDVYGEGGGNA